MGLVIENDDVLFGAQITTDPPNHLVGRLGEGAWAVAAGGEQAFG